MTDINSFNPDDIPASERTKKVVAGDINVGRKSPEELQQSQFKDEVEAQAVQGDSLFNISTLDDDVKRRLVQYSEMYYQKRLISEATIPALISYHFSEIMRRMQSEHDIYLMDMQMEDLMLRNFGMKREDLDKFKF